MIRPPCLSCGKPAESVCGGCGPPICGEQCLVEHTARRCTYRAHDTTTHPCFDCGTALTVWRHMYRCPGCGLLLIAQRKDDSKNPRAAEGAHRE